MPDSMKVGTLGNAVRHVRAAIASARRGVLHDIYAVERLAAACDAFKRDAVSGVDLSDRLARGGTGPSL